jgi:hypothetical protein
MPHEFDSLIADLEAAKADLARHVKRCRKTVGQRRMASSEALEKSAFSWSDDTAR